ncbi:MAG: rRNA adenine N-6-methyltransferase family protein [Phascolarctobacterium faecium]
MRRPLRWRLTAYYITTPIIFNLLEQPVGGRLSHYAEGSSRAEVEAQRRLRRFVSLTQYYTEPEIAFIVPPESFIPAPNVDSAVIVCKRRTVPGRGLR